MGREAVTLHCSSCGAPLRADARRCDHCSGEVTLEERRLDRLCSHCGARTTATARFCMRCGVGLPEQPVAPLPADAACPRCSARLRNREIGRFTVVECSSCGGLWLTPELLRRLCDESEKREAVVRAVAAPVTIVRTLAVAPIVYLPCPVCRDRMNRRNFGDGSGVIVDVCTKHGVWLDHQELEAVLEFVRAGGFDKTRRRTVERLEAEARHARARRDGAPAGFPPNPELSTSIRDGLTEFGLEVVGRIVVELIGRVL